MSMINKKAVKEFLKLDWKKKVIITVVVILVQFIKSIYHMHHLFQRVGVVPALSFNALRDPSVLFIYIILPAFTFYIFYQSNIDKKTLILLLLILVTSLLGLIINCFVESYIIVLLS